VHRGIPATNRFKRRVAAILNVDDTNTDMAPTTRPSATAGDASLDPCLGAWVNCSRPGSGSLGIATSLFSLVLCWEINWSGDPMTKRVSGTPDSARRNQGNIGLDHARRRPEPPLLRRQRRSLVTNLSGPSVHNDWINESMSPWHCAMRQGLFKPCLAGHHQSEQGLSTGRRSVARELPIAWSTSASPGRCGISVPALPPPDPDGWSEARCVQRQTAKAGTYRHG
jgi:hypothetical protein